MNTQKIKVLLVDDHALVRYGLRLILEKEEDFEVVGEAEDGRIAVQKSDELRPDIVVMDIVMPSLNGLEATKQISRNSEAAKVVILTGQSSENFIESAVEIQGLCGYLLKQDSPEDFVRGLRDVHRGKSAFSPSIAKLLARNYSRALSGGQSSLLVRKVNHLTLREIEVLQLVAEGHANKQIAALLEISIKTIEKHRQQVMNKLNIHDVAGLTRYAMAQGICSQSQQAG